MDSNIIDGTPVKDHQYVRKGPHNDRARFLGVLPLQSIGSLFEQTEMSLHSLHPRPPSHPKKKKNLLKRLCLGCQRYSPNPTCLLVKQERATSTLQKKKK